MSRTRHTFTREELRRQDRLIAEADRLLKLHRMKKALRELAPREVPVKL